MANLDCLFGIHAVQAVLESQPERCVELVVQIGERSGKIKRITELAANHPIRQSQLKKMQLDELVNNANHQGVVMKVKPAKRYSESDLEQIVEHSAAPLLLVLDSIQDPHNLGACLRTAEIMGVDAVIAPKDRACDITPVVRKVASGAAERVPFIRVTNLVRALKSLQAQGVWVSGAVGEANQVIDQVDFRGSTAIVMGAEGTGIRDLTRKACDHLVAIPMLGTVGSFNVSVACGICLYEVVRQRTTAIE